MNTSITCIKVGTIVTEVEVLIVGDSVEHVEHLHLLEELGKRRDKLVYTQPLARLE